MLRDRWSVTDATHISWAKALPLAFPCAATPAVAASPNPCVGDLCFGCASVHKCCSGGPQAFYWACVTFVNNGDTDVQVAFSFTVNTSANGPVPISGGGTVGAGETVSFKPQTPRQYGNCSTGSYDPFTITFTDGLGNEGSAVVPGGALDGGGNTCPDNTTCGPCGAAGQSLTQSQPAADEPEQETATVEEPAVETTEPVTEVETTQPVTDTATTDVETTDVQQGTDNASTTSAP